MSILSRVFKYIMVLYAAAMGVQLVALFISMARQPHPPVRKRQYATAASFEPPSSRYQLGTL